MSQQAKLIPKYFVTQKNTILQILFTSVFAFVFINLYRPFGSGEWYNVSWWEFSFYSALLVFAGMLLVLASRFLMLHLKRKTPVTIRYYILMIVTEIFLMAILYALLEKYVVYDTRNYFHLLYLALQNTALILLIPYVISLLFFSLQEKSVNLNNLLRQIKSNAHFIPFRDQKGILRLSLKSSDLLYIESSDNYISIKYLQNQQPKSFLIRNTLKNLEKDFEKTILLRCHRSYMVNVKKVRMVKKEGHNMKLLLEDPNNKTIPVSKGYYESVRNFFENTSHFNEVS